MHRLRHHFLADRPAIPYGVLLLAAAVLAGCWPNPMSPAQHLDRFCSGVADVLGVDCQGRPVGGFRMDVRFVNADHLGPHDRVLFRRAVRRWERMLEPWQELEGVALSFDSRRDLPRGWRGDDWWHMVHVMAGSDPLIVADEADRTGPVILVGRIPPDRTRRFGFLQAPDGLQFAAISMPVWLEHWRGFPTVGVVGISDFAYEEAARSGDRDGYLENLFAHEIGHLLGIGTLWDRNVTPPYDGQPLPSHTGFRTGNAWRALGGRGFVPLSPDATHWSEAHLGNEAMTPVPWMDERISAVSLGALGDLYLDGVHYDRAEPFVLPTAPAAKVAHLAGICGAVSPPR